MKFEELEIKEQTKQLKENLDDLKKVFDRNQPPASFNDKVFFQMVKNETSPIYDLLNEWEKNVLALIEQRQLNVHPQQIISTKENFELLLMHSYYIDCRRRRYMELNQSIHYILDQILND